MGYRPALALLEILRGEGVDRIFGNPGTTELPFLAALSEASGAPEYVPGVHEGAVVSMADGYARSVNIASAAVFTAPPEMVPYVASKTGLIGFTRALAAALGPYDITVNAIAPSMVRTATAERTVGAAGGFEFIRSQQVVPRTQEASDLVSTLLYVVDEGSGFLTGQTLNVSGGSAFL